MKQQQEVDLVTLTALGLLRWRQLLCGIAAAAVLAAVWVGVTFEPPSLQEEQYRSIAQVMTARHLAEEELAEARRNLEENLFYTMDPERIVTLRLTLLVELEDRSIITEQTDPTDMVLYAYHNLARSELRTAVLELLRPAQMEQLLSIGYDGDGNHLIVTITAQDIALAQDVLALCARWYQAQQSAVGGLTHAHRLILLPLSETHHTPQEREAMVSSAAARQDILELEEVLAQWNTQLDQLFSQPGPWAAMQTQEQLREALAEKQQADAQPGYLPALVLGGLIGGFCMMMWLVLPVMMKQQLLRETAIGVLTGWHFVGRLNPLPKAPDPLVRRGQALLYRSPAADREALTGEVRAMTELLLQDRAIQRPCTLALVGNVSPEAMEQAAQALAGMDLTLCTASPGRDRALAHRLCRNCDGVIFLGTAEAVTAADVAELVQILKPLGKTPLGYLLTT